MECPVELRQWMRELDKERAWDGQEVPARAGGKSVAADRSGRSERQDYDTGFEGSRDRRADVLPVRKEYGGLQVDQTKRLKELEQEKSKLKRLVANLSLDNLVLKDFASGSF